ncbi:MAG: A/G-specific adenine glycosylase [Rubrivivax sp.]|nr:A/G-specific adenine glycosylase [Rubrivivax sp.]
MTRAAVAARLRGLAGAVIAWQRTHGRHGLPWQGTRDAYRVWLSEVMLQQTQVGTVLDYYPRLLARFPDVQALAAAPLDDVLALWSGLGYYSRARNLHRCAQAVVAGHGGAFPASSALLATLPGIGRSTAAAIAAFCFGERAAILDGNVKRVLTRALGFDGDLSLAAEEKRLWALAEALLPARDVDVYTQGLMDLGATVCSRGKPACERCPLANDCVARAAGTQGLHPVKTRRLKRSRRSNALLCLRRGAEHFLVQRPERGVWAGLWSLPEYGDAAVLEVAVSAWPGEGEWLPAVEHALTHFDWTLRPLRWNLPPHAGLPADLPDGRWLRLDEALAMGLPAPVRKLLAG